MMIATEQVAQLLLFAAIGFFLCKAKIADNHQSGLLSRLCLYVSLPSTIFRTYATNFTPDYLKRYWSLMLISFVILALLVILSPLVAKLLTKDAYRQKIFRYSLTIPNYGYVGYALAEGIFGSQMLLNVMMFVMPMSLYTYSLGYCMLTRTKISLKRLLNPPMIALLAGSIVGYFGIDLPNPANLFLSKAAACNGPFSMLMTGMVISEYAILPMLKDWRVYTISAFRLLVIPIATAACLLLLGLDFAVIPALLVLAVPCGLNTVIFPKLIDEDCRTGASLAFVTSILCIVTVPVCLLLFGCL